MITHVVMMRVTDRKTDTALEIIQRLRGLPARIPEIRSYEAGANCIGSARAWDLVLVSTFDSPEALRSYQDHPDHVEVTGFIRASTEQVATVDYET